MILVSILAILGLNGRDRPKYEYVSRLVFVEVRTFRPTNWAECVKVEKEIWVERHDWFFNKQTEILQWPEDEDFPVPRKRGEYYFTRVYLDEHPGDKKTPLKVRRYRSRAVLWVTMEKRRPAD